MINQFDVSLKRAAELLNARHISEAETLLLELYKQKPFDPFVNYNLGNVYIEQKRTREAIRCYRLALANNPNLVPALVNLANCLIDIGDYREALRNTQMALRRMPDDYKLLSNLSIILQLLGEAPDALAAIERAAQLAPDEFEVLSQWAKCLTELQRWDALVLVCERALAVARGHDTALICASLLSSYSKRSSWDKLPPLQTLLLEWSRKHGKGLAPLIVAFYADDPEALKTIADDIHARNEASPRPAYTPTGSRITIGYMSPDFREHPVSQMIVDVFRHHDRERYRIVTFGVVPLDESSLCLELAKHIDEHVDLRTLSDDQAADRIRAAGVDVLVDLAGTTLWHRPGVMARRPCPVQLLWLGCPATTGYPWYDGFLVDRMVAPEWQDAWCTERLHRLPCCYHPISTGHHGPLAVVSRASLGLPEDVFILGLRLQPTKVIPPFINDVVTILQRCPRAHLWLKAEKFAREPIFAFFERHGIDRSRILLQASFFRQREEYLASLPIADLLIDSYPYGGHSTTGEALALGCPVVTHVGRSIHTRVAGSMLTELGMSELVTDSSESFIERVSTLIDHPAELLAVRERTRAAAQRYKQTGISRLCRGLEDSYTMFLKEVQTQA